MHILFILLIVWCIVARILQWICTDMVEVIRYQWKRTHRF